jgi:hypothetical protein
MFPLDPGCQKTQNIGKSRRLILPRRLHLSARNGRGRPFWLRIVVDRRNSREGRANGRLTKSRSWGGWSLSSKNSQTIVDKQEIPGITGGALDSHEALPGPIYLQGSEAGHVAFSEHSDSCSEVIVLRLDCVARSQA